MAVSPVGRVSYPHVFTKHAYDDGDAKHELTLIFSDDTDLSVIESAVAAAIKAKWGGKPPRKLKTPIRDGDEKDDPVYEGKKFCTFRTTRVVQVVDQRKQAIDEASGAFYAGCLARVSFDCFAFDHPQGGKGVSLGLNHVQKVADGEPLTSRTTADDDFDEVEVEEAASYFE